MSKSLLMIGSPIRMGLMRRLKTDLIELGIKDPIEVSGPSHLKSFDSVIRSGDWSAVIVVGGDGTVHAALPALVAMDLPLVVWPDGTGNDLAYCLNMKNDLKDLHHRLKSNIVRRTDLLDVNGQLGATMSGIGLAHNVLSQFEAIRKASKLVEAFGRHSYTFFALRSILTWQEKLGLKIRVSGDIEGEFNVATFLVLNQPRAGGRMLFAPQAKDDDGLLDVALIRTMNALGLAEQFIRLSLEKSVDHVERFKVAHLNLEMVDGSEFSYFIDGELMQPKSSLQFRVQPKFLSVLEY